LSRRQNLDRPGDLSREQQNNPSVRRNVIRDPSR